MELSLPRLGKKQEQSCCCQPRCRPQLMMVALGYVQSEIPSFPDLNLAAFITIVFAYLGMFYSIHITACRTAERSICSREVAIAKQLFFVVFTDALCWIPIFLLKLLSLLQVEIPGKPSSLQGPAADPLLAAAPHEPLVLGTP